MGASPSRQPSPRRRRGLCAAAALMAGLALSACQSSLTGSRAADPITTGATGEVSIKETALAGQRWRADPGNVRLGLAYAQNLQALGQTDEQLKVLDELNRRNPDNADLAAYYGKQLAFHGRTTDAERMLRRLVDGGQADWKVHSALGSALDQQNKFDEARRHYAIALESKPNELSVLNNLGMSFMLEGDLKKAEATFRQAVALPNGDREPRLRQNLALSVGLQGRFDEAREIASRDLPPEMVEANLTYLRSMLSQPNTWQQLKASPNT